MISVIKYLNQNNLSFSKDLYFEKNPDGFIIYNVKFRTSILIENNLYINLFLNPQKKLNKFKKYLYKDINEFNLWKNMYLNPNLIKTNKPFIKSNYFEIFEILESKNIFVSKKNSKKNTNNFFEEYSGNINKQILTETLFKKKNINEWWIEQKFYKNNLKIIKNTPYKFIQYNYLKKYLNSQKELERKSVLEIACGHGFYSNLFSKYFNVVYGFDYNKNYIEIANNLFKKNNLFYYTSDLLNRNFSKNRKFDYIFMIDVYLFFFDKKYQINLYKNKSNILKKIYNSLKKNGKLVIIDPHNFWLTPRFGSDKNPFGIISEYFNNEFSSLPPLNKRLSPLFEAGFKIVSFDEPKITNTSKKYLTNLDYNFLSEFPQWICLTLIK